MACASSGKLPRSVVCVSPANLQLALFVPSLPRDCPRVMTVASGQVRPRNRYSIGTDFYMSLVEISGESVGKRRLPPARSTGGISELADHFPAACPPACSVVTEEAYH